MNDIAWTGSLLSDRFNNSHFGQFINSPSGRAFRLIAGLGFLLSGLALLPSPVGIALLVWGVLPLSAGVLDLCWISAVLGGPLSGSRIRGSR